MRSIIQEAASIAKAIEQGWQKAGKPQSFSIKVLELEEKNFLGMTKKPAKIAFFFEEKTQTEKRTSDKLKKPKIQEERKSKKRIEKKVEKSQEKKPRKIVKKPTEKKSPWTDPMATEAKKWTQDVLQMMKLPRVKYSTTTFKNNIKFHFEAPLLENKNEQKILFSSFALLLMQTLRNKFKKQLRNMSAIFTTD